MKKVERKNVHLLKSGPVTAGRNKPTTITTTAQTEMRNKHDWNTVYTMSVLASI